MSVYVGPSTTFAHSWPASMLNAPRIETISLPAVSKEHAHTPAHANAHMMASYACDDMSPAEEARLLRAPKMRLVDLPPEDDVCSPYPRHTTCASPHTTQSSAAGAGLYSNALGLHSGYDYFQVAQSPIMDPLDCDFLAYEQREGFAHCRPGTPQSPSYSWTYARPVSSPSPRYIDTAHATYSYSPRRSPYLSPPPSPTSDYSTTNVNGRGTPWMAKPPRLSP